jgi:hypothetical protein
MRDCVSCFPTMAGRLLSMRHMTASRIALLAILVGGTTPVWATPTAASLGSSITISDGNSSGSGWYGNHEDNETEANPFTVKGQDWDLEGMYLKNKSLTLVGGFDFKNGNTYTDGHTYLGGDIFIDTTGDAKYTQVDNGGSGVGGNVANSFGYDYVIHFSADVTTYNVFAINSSSIVSRAVDIAASDPWRYVSGGTAVQGYQNVAIGGYGLLDASVANVLTTQGSVSAGLQGGYNSDTVSGTNPTGDVDNNHYYLTVDTSFLPSGSVATYHYTMECGNDNLMGRAAVADNATSTLFLLGGAMTLLVGYRRKFAKR